MELVNRWDWFAFVPEEGKRWFAEHCLLHTVEKGQSLYLHNDPVTHIYGLLSGSLRIYTASASGQEMTLEELAVGSWFPHFMLTDKPSYYGNCTATRVSTLVRIGIDDFMAFGERWPRLYKGLYAEFAARGAATIGRMELLTQHSLKVRLAVYLLRLVVVRGSNGADKGYFVESSDSQEEIANRVGGARQRVNAILKEWERTGTIVIAKNGLTIHNPHVLLAAAKESGFDADAYLEAWQGGWKSPFFKGSGFIS
nr:Crp/Fnr family transcriptional regulator [Spongiibacter thalassae]